MNTPDPDRLRALIAALEDGLLERDAAVRLALLTALAGEHLLLIGPPGTAKSELARRLHHAFADARYFERLLTRFSVPEELFGPLSLSALEHDRYERLVDGYLPTAGIAFLDEVFKANSAILNALLTLLNEREFDNGQGRVATPLVCVVGASNEVPADESLAAFYDRFLVRVPIAPVAGERFAQLLQLRLEPVRMPVQPISRVEMDALRTRRDAIELPADVLALLQALRARLVGAGIPVSDRRWRHTAGLLRTAALTEGRTTVDCWDLWLVPYCVLAEPAQWDELQAWYLDEALQAAPPDLPWLTRAVEAFEQQLGIETSMRQTDDDAAGKLALARSIGGTKETGIARLVSATLEDRLRQRYSPLHVHARVAQVNDLLARTDEARSAQVQRLAQVEAALGARLWMPPSLVAMLLGRERTALAVLQALQERLQQVREGYAGLPQDETLPATVPPPVSLEA